MSDGASVHVGGNVSGQLLVGNNGVQIQAQGDIVNPVFVSEPIRPRPRPVQHRPRRPEDLIGRNRAVAELVSVAGIENAQVAAYDGWGKSSVLKHVTHHEIANGFPDGVVFVAARGLQPDDIASEIYAAFFDCRLEQMGFKPTPAQVRSSLHRIRALVVLDDVDLDRRDVETLLDIAPDSTFITSAQTQTMWTDGLVVDLAGLSATDGAKLFARRLRTAVSGDDNTTVVRFCEAARGYPAAIVAAAAAMRRGRLSFADLDSMGRLPDPVPEVYAALDDVIAEDERRALAVLEAVNGAPLPAEAVAAGANVQAAGRILEGLRQDGVVQAASPRFRLPEQVAEYLELPDWRVDTLDGLTSWVLGVEDPDVVAAAATGIIHMIDWAARNQRSDKAVKLARAAGGGLMLSRRWAQWKELIDLARAAARASGSRFDEAWALHQDGTRSLCLGDNATAEQRLRGAEKIRSGIGDRPGLAATQHNLNILTGVAPVIPKAAAPAPPPPPAPAGGGIPWWLWIIIVAIVAFGGWRVYEYFQDPDDPVPPNGGEVEPGSLTIGPDRIDFGEVLVDDVSEIPFQVRNDGPGPLQVTAIEMLGSDLFEVDHDCNFLEAVQTCSVTAFFTAAEPGEHSATLLVEHTGSNGTVEREAVAVVVPRPEAFLQVEPVLVDFPPVGQEPPEVIERIVAAGPPGIRSTEVLVSNPGDTVVGFETALESGREFTVVHECGRLDPGDSCTLVLNLVASEPGTYEDRLFVDHDASNDNYAIPLVGTVIGGPDLVGAIVDSGAATGRTDTRGFVYWAIPVEVEFSNPGGAATLDDFAVWFEWFNADTGEFQWIPSGRSREEPTSSPTVTNTVPALGSITEPFFVAFDVELYEPDQSVTLQVFVDSCRGEESIADPPCRIEEANEDNNMSEPFDLEIRVDLDIQ